MMDWLLFTGIIILTWAAVGAIYWERIAKRLERENADLRAQVRAFDHDGDGNPGGSKPRGKG